MEARPRAHEKIAGYTNEPQDRTAPWTQNASTSSAPPSKTSRSARKSYGGIFDFDAKFERLRTVNASLEDPSVWNDPKKAQELGKEQKSLSAVVVTLDKLTRELADNAELYEMSKEEGDEAGLLHHRGRNGRCARSSRSLNSAACSATRPIR